MKTKLLFIAFACIIASSNGFTQTWNLAGNTGTKPSANFLGTIDKKALALRTYNMERLRITNKGQVGIGTATPLQKLDVNGNINIAVDSGLYIGNNRILYSSASGDLACGYIALYSNPEGSGNTACGSYTLPEFTDGDFNTAIGSGALNSLQKGYFNTAIGGAALILDTAGNGNTALGYFATSVYHTSNSTAIGYHSITNASNQVRIGDIDVNSIGGFTDWTNISDRRVKKNIKENVPGLIFINKLKPVTYNLDLNTADKITMPVFKSHNGKSMEPSQQDMAARKLKEQIVYTGFIAQDVEKAAKELNYDFSGVDAAKNDKDLYGLRYAEFVVPLVKAVQELSLKNEALENKNDQLEERIKKLETLLNVQPVAVVTTNP